MEQINEMAYPSHFNEEQFKSLKSYNARIQYCNEHLERIGSGSARVVYKIDEEKCLKLAKNKKGIAQNREEVNSFRYFGDITTKCFDYDENDFLWVEMELAKKVKKSDFKRLTGHSFEFMQDFIMRERNSRVGYKYFKGENGDFTDEYKELIDSDEYEDTPFNYISDYIADNQLMAVGDLKRLSSWGIVTDKEGNEFLVLVDFGVTDEILDEYYRH